MASLCTGPCHGHRQGPWKGRGDLQGTTGYRPAILLFGIHTWLKNNYDHLRLDGRRHCARSLSELLKDHPYFSKSGIEKIIKRAEAKGFLHVRRDRKKLHFWLPEQVEAMCRRMKGRIRFRVKDAELYGEKAAILLANLQWQRDNNLPHVAGEGGQLFYPLPPVILSNYLPISRWTIARELQRMTTGVQAVLVEHRSVANHFATIDPNDGPPSRTSARAEGEQDVAKGEGDVAEGGKIQMGDSNEDQNPDKKWSSNAPLATASPVQAERLTSSTNQAVTKLINDALATAKARSALPHPRVIICDDDDEYEINPDMSENQRNELINGLQEEELELNIRLERQLLQDKIDISTDDMVEAFRLHRLKCTKVDEARFQRLFLDNSELSSRHLIGVLNSCMILRSGIPERGITIGESYMKVEDDALLTFPKRVASAQYFLDRLGEIIAQLSGDEMDEHFVDLNYNYLGKPRVNKVVQLDYESGHIDREQ